MFDGFEGKWVNCLVGLLTSPGREPAVIERQGEVS